MPATSRVVLTTSEASDLFEGIDRGSVEALGSLEGCPLILVDDPGPHSGLTVPPLLPSVTVALGPHGAGLDVAAGSDGDLARIEQQVHAFPTASVTLVQVLRAGSASIEHDLLTESLAYSSLRAGPEHARWRRDRPPVARRSDPGPAVTTSRHGATLTITLDRPHVRNAYSASMRDGLCAALAEACGDAGVQVVELRGRGPAFCSGGDLDEFGTGPDAPTAHIIRTARSAARLLGRLGPRTVAHLHGACIGAGIELPALAGRVLADRDTYMALPEVGMGLIPGAGGTASIPRRIGRERTAWMALTARPVDAATALAWGLVDQIV